MARSDWTALRTAPAAEYTTRSELERFGLSPYLMQASVRYITPGGITVNKLRPAVARVVLLPFAQAHSPTLRLVPHLQLLPIRIPGAIVSQLMLKEATSEFDDVRPTRQSRQASVAHEIALWLPRRQFAAVPRADPDVDVAAIRYLTDRLSHALQVAA